MVAVIADNIISTTYYCRNDTLIYSKTSRKAKCFIFPYEFSQFLFQFNMYIKSTVQKTGTGTSCTIFFSGSNGSVNDSFVICQSHICVRTEHQDLFAIHRYLCILMAVNCAEIGIYPFCHKLLRQIIFREFVLQ